MGLCYDGPMKRLTIEGRRGLSTLLILCLMLLLSAGAETQDAQPVIVDEAIDAQTPAAETPYEGLEVYFLDLGRVDGILIRCGGENCFIDVGLKEGARPAIRFLQAMGISHLNSYVGTHAHADHIGGGPDIIDAFHPDRLYLPHEKAVGALMECADDVQKTVIAGIETVILRPGDAFTIGSAVMTTLGPLTIRNVSTDSTSENSNSLIQRLDYGNRSFLFTGDTSSKVLRAVNKHFPGKLNVDVFKNPHHNGAQDEDVVDMIRPAIAVFCTDDDFQPTQKYQNLLRSKGSRIYITGSENQGNIAIVTDGNRLELRCGYSVDSVALDPVPKLYVGQEYDVKAGSIPARQLGWNSSDEAIVQAYNGRLRVIGEGKATVTATAINGASASVEVECWRAFVSLDQTELSLGVGETKKLSGRIVPENPQGVSGEWLSEDPGVATVSGGKVTGVGEGTTRVIARLSNGAEAVCEVTVKGRKAKAVKLSQTKATMKVGDTLSLTASVEPADYDASSLEWYSSDESILWVDQNGNITAVKAGKAKIAAVAGEDVYDICTIKVK